MNPSPLPQAAVEEDFPEDDIQAVILNGDREDVIWANAEVLTKLIERHGLFIRAADLSKWRPTARVAGDIPGVRDNLICIATDGLMGYFLSEWEPSEPAFFGHVTSFQWHKEIVSMVPYYDKVAKRTKWFQNVRKSGTPPALFRRDRKPTTQDEITEYEKAKQKKPRKKSSPFAAALELLRTLQPKS